MLGIRQRLTLLLDESVPRPPGGVLSRVRPHTWGAGRTRTAAPVAPANEEFVALITVDGGIRCTAETSSRLRFRRCSPERRPARLREQFVGHTQRYRHEELIRRGSVVSRLDSVPPRENPSARPRRLALNGRRPGARGPVGRLPRRGGLAVGEHARPQSRCPGFLLSRASPVLLRNLR